MSSTEPVESSVPRKRSNMDNETENNEAKKSKNCTERLKLTDMNDYCLVKIFKFLNLQDLVNIAETDDRFVNAAILAFSSKYCQTNEKAMLGLGLYLDKHLHKSRCIESLNDSEAFFRHFGHLTSKLTICFWGFNEDVDKKILKYLQEKCTESLIDLELIGISDDNIDTVFPNVLSLSMDHSRLKENMCQLKAWFPNLKKLELFRNKYYTHPKLLERNFANLIEFVFEEIEQELPDSTLVEFFRLNPQLRELDLTYNYAVSLLRLIPQSLPQLEKLRLSSLGCHFDGFTGPPVVFKTVKSFELELSYSEDPFERNSVLIPPFRFINLEKLTIYVFKKLNCLLPFIQDCSADELTLKECSGEISLNDLSDVMNIRNLKELRFCVHEIIERYPLEDDIEVGGIGDDNGNDNEDGDDSDDENEDGDDSDDDNEDGENVEDENGDDDGVEDGDEDADIAEEIDWLDQMSYVMFAVTVLLRMNTRLQKIHLMFPNSGDRSAYCDIVENGVLPKYKLLAQGCNSCTEAYRGYYCLCLERKKPSFTP